MAISKEFGDIEPFTATLKRKQKVHGERLKQSCLAQGSLMENLSVEFLSPLTRWGHRGSERVVGGLPPGTARGWRGTLAWHS